MGFTKLFSDIIASSIWNEDDKTRIVWITLLAMKGPNNITRASIDGLAHQARVSIEDCKAAIEKLSGPDPYSGDPEFDGRRIAKVNHGWLILNGLKYQMRRDEEDRKEYMATYMKQYRRKASEAQSSDESVNKTVNESKLSEQPLKNVTGVSPSESANTLREEKKTKAKEKIGENGASLRSLAELKSRIGGWFKRRETTQWSEKEMKALRQWVDLPEEDLEVLEAFYTAKIVDSPTCHDIRRREVLTLLNNLPGEVDKAIAYRAMHQKAEFKPIVVEEIQPVTPESRAASRDLFASCELKRVTTSHENRSRNGHEQ